MRNWFAKKSEESKELKARGDMLGEAVDAALSDNNQGFVIGVLWDKDNCCDIGGINGQREESSEHLAIAFIHILEKDDGTARALRAAMAKAIIATAQPAALDIAVAMRQALVSSLDDLGCGDPDCVACTAKPLSSEAKSKNH